MSIATNNTAPALASLEIVQKAHDYLVQRYQNEGSVFLQDIYAESSVASVTEEPENIRTVVFKVFTKDKLRNSLGMVHGGACASLLTIFSTLALAADAKYWPNGQCGEKELAAWAGDLGYTRAMESQNIQAVPLETDILIRCRIYSNTKSNAYVTASITTVGGRTLVAGNHDMIKRRSLERPKL